MNIHESVFVAEGSVIKGDVTIGKDSGVWFNAVVRGDTDRIVIGERTNVQDGSVLHVDTGFPLTIGDDVTIGHNAIVHGCTIGNNVIIGMGAIVLNGAVIGDNCVIGAGALVSHGREIPAGKVAFGSPAQVKKDMTPEAVEHNRHSAEHYAELAKRYMKE